MNVRRVVISVVLGGLALAGCGGEDEATTAASAATQSAATVSGTTAAAAFNDADVDFAQGMIVHHEQAIQMADIALDPSRGASGEVSDLATRIRAAQGPEVDQMTALLTAWGQPLAMEASGGHDMSSMDGTMSTEDMEALAAMTGAEFDGMWLEMMIEHHTQAVSMAEEVKASGVNPDVQQLADQIISAQRAEIDEMTALTSRS